MKFFTFSKQREPNRHQVAMRAFDAAQLARREVYNRYVREKIIPLLRPATLQEYSTWVEKRLQDGWASNLTFSAAPMPAGLIHFAESDLTLITFPFECHLTIIVPNMAIVTMPRTGAGSFKILNMMGPGINDRNMTVFSDVQISSPALTAVAQKHQRLAALERAKQAVIEAMPKEAIRGVRS